MIPRVEVGIWELFMGKSQYAVQRGVDEHVLPVCVCGFPVDCEYSNLTPSVPGINSGSTTLTRIKCFDEYITDTDLTTDY